MRTDFYLQDARLGMQSCQQSSRDSATQNCRGFFVPSLMDLSVFGEVGQQAAVIDRNLDGDLGESAREQFGDQASQPIESQTISRADADGMCVFCTQDIHKAPVLDRIDLVQDEDRITEIDPDFSHYSFDGLHLLFGLGVRGIYDMQ